MADARTPPAAETHDHVLDGCRPVPLAGYLKALGVLRLVSEQRDPTARGWWRDDRFVLRTTLDPDALTGFFLEDYAPTPIIAPWNGAGGFFLREGLTNEKDPSTGRLIKTGVREKATAATKILSSMSESRAERFSPYRDTIRDVASVLNRLGYDHAPKDDDKQAFISDLRSNVSSSVVEWIDAVAALLSDSIRYAPLLGAGGNDGALDFGNNFMQRLTELFSPKTGEALLGTTAALSGALFGRATTGLSKAKIGQFSPGAAGGPNASTGAEGDAQLNRWDFVLMLEGAMVFAGGVSRRLESCDASYLSYPFTVHAAAAGFGTASLEEADTRGELWVPLWDRPTSLAELRTLFREGRLSVGARPARDGLDAARAIDGLGANRRVAAFERYGFIKRRGDAFLAAPLGRRVVQANPRGELLTDLDRGSGQGWLAQVRRTAAGEQGSAAYRSAVSGLEEGVFALLDRPQDPLAVQQVLVSVGAVARATALRPKLREEPMVASPPPPRLTRAWLEAADDRSPEWRVALALAGLDEFIAHLGPMRPGGRAWASNAELGQADVLAVWGEGSLVDNLGAVVRRRLLAQADEPFAGGRFLASAEDVAAFLDERGFDDRRAAELLLGLAWVEPGPLARPEWARPPALPFAYAAIKPLFTPAKTLADARARRPGQGPGAQGTLQAETDTPADAGETAASAPDGRADTTERTLALPMPPALPGLLAAGRVGEAVRLAQRRARASGLPTPFLDDRAPVDTVKYPATFGARLLAALAIPVHAGVVSACLRQANPSPEADTESDDAA